MESISLANVGHFRDDRVDKTNVDIVIVNYNTREYLKICLENLISGMARKETKTIIVDNASTDGSAEMVEKEFPSVILVRNSQNLGFAAAVNQAIRLSSSSYILLLNPDTLPPPCLDESLVLFIDNHPEAGAIGCKIVNPDGSTQSSAYIRFPSLMSYLTMFLNIDHLIRKVFPNWNYPGKYELSLKEYNSSRELAHISGACIMLRRSALDRIGLLDEHFYFSREETDLQYRIKTSGYSILYYPDVKIVHFGGVSSVKMPLKGRNLYIDGELTYFLKYYGRGHTALMTTVRIIDETCKALIWGAIIPFIFIFKPKVILRNIKDHLLWVKLYSLSLGKSLSPFDNQWSVSNILNNYRTCSHDSIIFIARAHNPPKTGGEAYHQSILKALRIHGYEVLHTQPEDLPLRISGGLRYNIYLAHLLVRKKFGTIIINSDFSCRLFPLLIFASIILRIRIISLVHHFYEVDQKYNGMKRGLILWGERRGLQLSDKIITISAFTSNSIQSKNIKRDRIIVIHPATELPKQPWKERYSDGKPINLLYVGYCTKRKGLEYLLRGINLIRDIDIVLDIVGDTNIEPRYVEYLQKLIESLDIQQKVKFHGLVSQERLYNFYETADIFVLPSILEGYGISLLEASRFGLPIVSTKSGAIPELIRDRENGLLVPPADPEALTSAILEIISNRDLRCTIARKAWEETRDEYSWETVGDNFVKALKLN